MATIAGTALLGKALGHTDAEKAFRPWWDVLEDFLVYGLVMAGIIVVPTSAVNSTPLECTQCIDGNCPDKYLSEREGPSSFGWRWVKHYCTVTALDRFILYFPYILLGVGFSLIAIEKMFTRLFKADRKVESFYKLIVKEALEDPYGVEQEVIEESRDCIEVLYSYRKSNNFFLSYVTRTIVELVVAIFLFILLSHFGIDSLTREDFVYCNVHGYFYECAGHHRQFYEIVLGTVLTILLGYIVLTFYNMIWLLIPYFGKMSYLMKNLRRYGGSTLHQVYFNNRDLSLMLDLLAENAGVAPALRILGLFDKEFRATIQPSAVSVERLSGAAGDVEIRVKFEEAIHAGRLLSHSKLIPNILYTVEARPHTKSSSIEIFSSATGSATDLRPKTLMVDGGENGSEMREVSPEGINYTSVIRDVDPKKAYCVCVSTIINGKTVARYIENFSAMEEEEETIEDAKKDVNVGKVNTFHGR